MNAKKCKEIRARARGKTRGQPYRSYTTIRHKDRVIKLLDGTFFRMPMYQYLLDKDCTRAVIKKMKRAA